MARRTMVRRFRQAARDVGLNRNSTPGDGWPRHRGKRDGPPPKRTARGCQRCFTNRAGKAHGAATDPSVIYAGADGINATTGRRNSPADLHFGAYNTIDGRAAARTHFYRKGSFRRHCTG